MRRIRDASPQLGHGFGQVALLRPYPERSRCTCNQKSRGVALARAIALFRNSHGVVVGSAAAGFAIHRANAMAVLGDLYCRPVAVRQSRNQAGDYASLAQTA